MNVRIQWNPIYKAFHRIRHCGNERSGPWQFKRALDVANLRPAAALEQGCVKQTQSASILFFHTNLACVSKCRDGSGLGLCMTSEPVKKMLLHSADFQLKFEFGRKIRRKSTLRSRILFISTEVMHKPSFNSYYILI